MFAKYKTDSTMLAAHFVSYFYFKILLLHEIQTLNLKI